MSATLPDPKSIVAIQLTATRINGGGVEMTSLADPNRTHLSLYFRYNDGSAEWLRDLPVQDVGPALTAAAKLSMQYQVPIERMEGLSL